MTLSRIAAVGLGLLIIVTIPACQVTQPPSVPTAGPPPAAADPATLLQRALGAPAGQAARLRLDAARLYFERTDVAEARSTLALIDPAQLDAVTQFEFYDLSLQLALDAGDLGAAHAAADRAIPMNTAQRNTFAQSSAGLAEREHRYADAATALMTYDYGAHDASESAQTLIDRTWSDVNRTPIERMTALATGSGPIARAWWELAIQTQRSFDASAERSAVTAWRDQHPRHPAATWLPSGLRALESEVPGPRQFALLLPMTGPLADAGRAVRDGFMAAFYYAGSDGLVKVYDSNVGTMTDLYALAVQAGAQVVIGPLDKARVAEMNAVTPRPVAVLALNYLPDGTQPSAGLLQFGLAIEDDARAIARRVLADGDDRVIVLEADADWAHRAGRAFTTQFVAGGGVVVTDAMVEDARTITNVVGDALLVDASTARRDEVAATIGVKPEFVPRRRTDVDAIVAFVGSVQARALKPALAFHFATEIPVYATAQATGTATNTELNDLDGLRLTELPWLVYPSTLRSDVDAAFSLGRSTMAPLYALGVDAYRVADRADLLAADGGGLFGETGQLEVTGSGSLLRDPAWAVVSDGNLVALPTVVQ